MTMHQPTISFIIPIYNIQSYLADSIESILPQNISKEIILVDDGSTDGSLDIALHYAKQYAFIKVIHSQNRGVSHARNLGLSIARGEYVYFLDGDDILDPNADFSLIYHIAKQHHLDVIKGQYIKYHIANPTQIEWFSPIYAQVQGEQFIHTSLQQFFYQINLQGWYTQISMLLIKRDFLVKNQIFFDEKLSYSEDVLFIIHMLSREGYIAEISMIFAHYRMRDSSYMMQPFKEYHLQTHLYIAEQLMLMIEQNPHHHLIKAWELVLAIHIYYIFEHLVVFEQEIQQKYRHLIPAKMMDIYHSKKFHNKNINRNA